jgi:hypothetical protein
MLSVFFLFFSKVFIDIQAQNFLKLYEYRKIMPPSAHVTKPSPGTAALRDKTNPGFPSNPIQ